MRTLPSSVVTMIHPTMPCKPRSNTSQDGGAFSVPATDVVARRLNVMGATLASTASVITMVRVSSVSYWAFVLITASECAYQEQSTRRRKRASQNIQALEERLRHAKAFIQALTANSATGGLPQHSSAEEVGCALDEQELRANSPPGDIELEGVEDDSDASSDEVTLEFLDSDDQGYRNYYGQSSGLNYMRRLKGQLGAMNLIEPVSSMHPSIDMRLQGERIGVSGPSRKILLAIAELPTQEVARRLCFNAIEHACTVMRFVHEPTFFASLDRIYEIKPSEYTKHDELFLPFLYAVMALGCVGIDDGLSPLSSGIDHAMSKGYANMRNIILNSLILLIDCFSSISHDKCWM